MKHRFTAPFFAVLVLALAAFTGSAFAGGGNGNGSGSGNGNGNSANAPGHQNTSTPAQAPTAAPAAAPAPAPAPAAKNADKAAASSSKHESKQSSTSASNPASGGSNAQGVKPSNATKHDTYAKASSSQTKQYGNGKTAGQIATQAGYGDATLHGPGNSQPHKVLCGGHEVDVHALKHKGSKCGTSTPAAAIPATPQSPTSATESSTCTTTTRTVSAQVAVVLHKTGNGKYVRIHPNGHSAHYSKHPDDIKGFETVTRTESVPTGANCSSTAPTVISTQVTGGPTAPAAPAAAAAAAPAAAAPTAAASAATASAAAPAAAAPVVSSGVKGAVVVLHHTKAKPAGGVLGTTTHLGGTVAGTTLPFTGLPLWIFTLAALALIAVGITVRRSSANRI